MEITKIYGEVLGVKPDHMYIKYAASMDWGWNGGKNCERDHFERAWFNRQRNVISDSDYCHGCCWDILHSSDEGSPDTVV